jgi:biopolymer transport protein ExbD
MGVSVDASQAASKKKPVDAELNLIPFIDLLVCCICFLLITAVWLQMARINVSQQSPGISDVERPPAPPLPRVTVLVADDGYTLTVGTERLSIPKQGEVYDTEALHKRLREVRTRLTGAVPLTVAADDPVKYRHLVRTMDIALESDFTKIHVSDAAARL